MSTIYPISAALVGGQLPGTLLPINRCWLGVIKGGGLKPPLMPAAMLSTEQAGYLNLCPLLLSQAKVVWVGSSHTVFCLWVCWMLAVCLLPTCYLALTRQPFTTLVEFSFWDGIDPAYCKLGGLSLFTGEFCPSMVTNLFKGKSIHCNLPPRPWVVGFEFS